MMIGGGLLVSEVRFLVRVRIVILAILSLVGLFLFLQSGCAAGLYLGCWWHRVGSDRFQRCIVIPMITVRFWDVFLRNLF